ncbi:MAG: RNA polymerase sigma factor [Lentisphaeria bacterium]|nr:RNA polymerase sigma factor [Lentisphaeria bacterium]
MKKKEEIFSRLIAENLKPLQGFVFKFLGDSSEVDDVIQESLLIAWNRFPQLRSEDKLIPWIYRIVANKCKDRLKVRSRENAKLKSYAAEKSSEVVEAEDDTLLDKLKEAILKLPSPHQETITIGVLANLSSEEAAKKLNCSTNTLYQRIFKAKQFLKKQLGVQNG